jgi:hypothetical protein
VSKAWVCSKFILVFQDAVRLHVCLLYKI